MGSVFQYLRSPFQGRHETAFAWALFATDLVLIAIFIIYKSFALDLEGSPTARLVWRFNIGSDNSIPEHFNFFKWTAIMIFMVAMFLSKRDILSILIFVVFAVILADDSVELHERAGKVLASGALSSIVSSENIAQIIGELLYLAAQGVFVFALLGIAFKIAGREDRVFVTGIIASLIGLIIVGVGLDAVHALFEGNQLAWLLTVAEDGGEMLFASLACAYGFSWFHARLRPSQV